MNWVFDQINSFVGIRLHFKTCNSRHYERFWIFYELTCCPVVVDIHQQWCGPCTGMLSNLKKIRNDIGDDLLKLAVVSCMIQVSKLFFLEKNIVSLKSLCSLLHNMHVLYSKIIEGYKFLFWFIHVCYYICI